MNAQSALRPYCARALLVGLLAVASLGFEACDDHDPDAERRLRLQRSREDPYVPPSAERYYRATEVSGTGNGAILALDDGQTFVLEGDVWHPLRFATADSHTSSARAVGVERVFSAFDSATGDGSILITADDMSFVLDERVWHPLRLGDDEPIRWFNVDLVSASTKSALLQLADGRSFRRDGRTWRPLRYENPTNDE